MLNLLHLLALLIVSVCLYVLGREWRGERQSRGQLLLAPILAFACAFVMIGFAAAEDRRPDLLRVALALGGVLGAIRGLFMEIEVDQWTMVNLPSGRDSFVVGGAIALAVAVAALAPFAGPVGRDVPACATAAAALGATFLGGRALVVYLRSRQ